VWKWEERRPAFASGSTLVRREPVGVVGAIVPWNYPQALAMMKTAPALAAGCQVVLKPALETALDAYVLAEAAFEAGLPPGVLNIVPGGLEAGRHWSRIPMSTSSPSPVPLPRAARSPRSAVLFCVR
jgi:aldehyde dehydrogenase (NAD+)